MELREIIKKLIISYPTIYGCTMMATLVFCLIFHPDAVFGIDYLGKAMLFALAGDLPSLVFYSKREPDHRSWMIRQVIHLFLLETVLLVFGRYLDYYDNVTEGVLFFFIVLIVYVVVRTLAFSGDFREAKKINQILAKRKSDKK